MFSFANELAVTTGEHQWQRELDLCDSDMFCALVVLLAEADSPEKDANSFR